MAETRYRIEMWNGGAWQRVGYEYRDKREALAVFDDLVLDERQNETAFRFVKCTYEVLHRGGNIIEEPTP